MRNEVYCKACGYIMREEKLGEVCPACGVPKTAFEPYKEKLSERRRFILDLHLHPITVHFPQAFASIIPVLIIGGILLTCKFGDMLISTATVLIYLLPLTVLPSIAAGLIDGKTRFKSLTTIALKRKIITGSLLLVLSILMAVYTFTQHITMSSYPLILAMSIACILCEVILGQIGNKLMDSKLPG